MAFIYYSTVLFFKDEAMNPGVKEMEAVILECAKLDREINHFVDIVQQIIQVNAKWDSHVIRAENRSLLGYFI